MSDDPNLYYRAGLGVDAYDLFYETALSGAPVAGDVLFYVERARAEGRRVLELAVGTGRVALELAAAGFAVTGIDISPAMLGRARANIEARGLRSAIRLFEADMTDFALGGLFDSAIIAFRSLQHVVTPAGQRRVFETVRRHLRPGGLLMFDVFDADLTSVVPGALSPAPTREARDPRTGARVRRTVIERENDPFAQTIRERMRLEAFDADGALMASEESAFTLRWATFNEMASMLELSGFKIEACYGDFRGGPPGYKREQIWLARNP